MIKIVCLSGKNLFPFSYIFIAWQITFTIITTLTDRAEIQNLITKLLNINTKLFNSLTIMMNHFFFELPTNSFLQLTIAYINKICIYNINQYHFWSTNRFLAKGTLMQIWNSPYMLVFIWKQYPEYFAFLILRILELFAREVCIFLKKVG